MQGWRCNQEDDHFHDVVKDADNNEVGMLLCVWDGHGGKEVAEFAREKFQGIFVDS